MNDELLSKIRELYKDSKNINVSTHAAKRMAQRRLKLSDAKNVMSKGEIIEDYPNDFPYPSCLMLGKTLDGSPLHICVAYGDNKLWLISVYIPDNEHFETDNKTRKGQIQ